MSDVTDRIADAIWTELERQQDDPPNGHVFVDRDCPAERSVRTYPAAGF